MDEVTVYFPLYECGSVVAEMTLHIRPVYDEAAPGHPLNFSDMRVQDIHDKSHYLPTSRATELLTKIRLEMPDEWREIEEAAEANFLEGCDEDREPMEPVYAA